MGGVTQQLSFTTKAVKKSDCKQTTNARRKNTLTYNFLVNQDWVQVCRKFFLETLDIKQDMFGALKNWMKVGLLQNVDRDVIQRKKDHHYLNLL